MIIRHIEEITAVYPTSQWDSLDLIKPLFLKVERTKLGKYLGFPLLSWLNSKYDSYADPQTGLADIDNTGNEDKEKSLLLDVLRTSQEVIVYIALSNNVRILSSSLNQGGGFNSMTATDYEQSSDAQLKALSSELWRNAMDSLDSLLLLLEQDAKEDHILTDKWKQSSYFYMHSDLIFRTADELSNYVNIDGGRAAYIQLTPALRNIQNQNIETRIGRELTQMLIEDRCPDDNPIAPFFVEFSRHCRLALANYVNKEIIYSKIANSTKSQSKSSLVSEMSSDYHLSGDKEMSLALGIVLNHPIEFRDFISKSSTLQYEYKEMYHVSWGEYLDSVENKPSQKDDSLTMQQIKRKQYDAICDLGGWHLD